MAFNSTKLQQLSPSEIERENLLNQEKKNSIKINVKIIKMLHYNKETGFFVLSAIFTPGKIAPRIIINGKIIYSKEIIVTGVSPTIGENNNTGQIIDCTGQWVEDAKYGIQFKTLFVNEELPESPQALKKYLSAGRIKHITAKRAEIILENWGMESFNILKNNPEELTNIPGITIEKAKAIQKQWTEKLEVYEIVSFLGMHNISESHSIKAYNYYKSKGTLAIEYIKNNPYELIKIEGIGFKTADSLALSLGINFNDLKRLRAALYYELEEKIRKDGDTAIPLIDWVNNSIKELGIEKEEVLKVCQNLITNKEVIVRDLEVKKLKEKNGKKDVLVTEIVKCVSPKKEAYIERNIAYELKRIMEESLEFDLSNIKLLKDEILDPIKKLDKSQIEAVWDILTTNKISLLTGGPGTGKTTTLKTLVYIAEKMGLSVVLSAPTGKAAKRMKESINREAKTIHRRLKYNPQSKGNFEFNQNNPLKGDVFIIDEMSMVDNSLFLSFLLAIPNGASLILVGDSDQISSVGSGNVLKDLQESKLILEKKLNFIHRTGVDSQIPVNAKLINEGKTPSLTGDIVKDSYVFEEAFNDEEIVDKLLNSVNYLLSNNYKPQDIQILTPQKNGIVGVDNLNNILKELLQNKELILNNSSKDNEDMNSPVSVGDKLMQIKNDYELDIFNGDMGYVEKIDNINNNFLLKTDEEQLSIPFSKAKDLVLGYAITIHKSQGSESPVIILPISSSHMYSLNKNLIYTGLTRGKKKVIIISNERTITKAVAKISNNFRITGLKEQIKLICKDFEYQILELY